VPEPPATAQRQVNPLRWRSLLALCVLIGLVWVLSDGFVIAIPTISKDLGGSTSQMAWAISGFALGACFSSLFGRLGDERGNRLLVTAGALLFIAGSIVGGLSQSPDVLIAARVLEGAGGYAIFTCSLALITLEFPLGERARALGIRAAIGWAAAGTAVLILALVLEALGWRAIFWLAIPVAIGGLVLTIWTTPEQNQGDPGASLDGWAVAALVASFTVLTYALIESDQIGLGAFAGLLALSAAILALFALIETRSSDPLIPPSVWRRPTFTGSIAVNFVLSLVLIGIFYPLALYLQTIRGLDSIDASAVLLGATIAIIIFNVPGARMAARGRFSLPVFVGMGLMAVGCAVIFVGIKLEGSAGIFAGLVILGGAIGIQLTSLSTMQVSSAGSTQGVAAGVVGIMYGVSVALGTGLATAAMQNVGRYEISQPAAASSLQGIPTDQVLGVFSGSVPLSSFSPEAAQTITAAFNQGVMVCALIFGVLALAGLGLALALLRNVRIEE